ncbi:hypothetical protein [Muribaculum sp.]|uniref:hypothetical protein n=1 Tax=Muribaculum sp. TaxID=1918611 RepID=UPI0023BFD37C|nr:hypothetical protein [Muribaculum sp.]MDE5704443.1 hypothetical protein [Muribaculum sp.]
MKKHLHFLFLALFAALPLVLTSCGDDDDEPGSSNSIVGTWQVSYYDEYGDYNVTETYIFKDNGTVVYSYKCDEPSDNYTLTNNYKVVGDLSKGAILEVWGNDADGDYVEISTRVQLINNRLYLYIDDEEIYLTRVS